MDAIAELALSALDNAVAGLLPGSAPNGLQRQMRIVPLETRCTGLGGHIGIHPEPRGNILGRQILARLEVTIRGGNDDAAANYLNQVARTLMAQDRGELRRRGIQRLKLRSEGLELRSAQFELFYDYRHLPAADQGVIENLDVNLDANLTPYQAQYLWDLSTRTLAGAGQPLADFQIADDPDLDVGSPPAQWQFDGTEACLAQKAPARGGPLDLSEPKKAGAQLLWRPGGAPLRLERFMAAVQFKSASPNGLGLVFGREDEDNFWYFLASQRHRYHLFGRKGNGAYTVVGTPAGGVGFTENQRHWLRVVVYDQTLSVELDGVQTLQVQTSGGVAPGELGLLTHGNDGARFYRVRLIKLV